MSSTTSFPRERMRVLLLEDIHLNAARAFRKAGYTDVKRLSRSLSGDALTEALSEVHIVGIRSKTQLTAEVIDAAPKLMAVGCFCIGTNQVDLESATSRGIPVFNSPYSNTRSVAELVLAELIFMMRRIPERDRAAHTGGWLKDAVGSFEVRGKTLGIVGYGHIGSQVSVLAESLGLRVCFYDIAPKLPLGNATSMRSLTELLKVSDAVTLHVPGGQGTHMMMNARALRQMKASAMLLNLSRGTVVDIEALAEALREGRLSGAAVDVFPVEPKSRTESFVSPLQGLPNAILTPHIGGSTQEAQQNIGLDVSAKLLAFIETGATTASHSVPELNLPVHEGAHRILHVHDNRPGILSAINQALAKQKINILGQYLNTNERIGYVVLDIDKRTSRRALDSLKKVPHTIRTRILF